MLSYQHAFHAGNHADVLKHIVLIAVLQKLNKKAKAYFALDTHAGTGIYDLRKAPINADASAFKTLLEHEIERDNCSGALSAYVQLVNELQLKSLYPGSPYLLSYFSRKQDNVHANELSAPMFTELERSGEIFKVQGQSVHLHNRDGFELLKALTPPTPNRGVVLIDPPYEQAKEYHDLVSAVGDALKKWPNGSYLIWYPLLSPNRINRNTKLIEPNPKASQSGMMLRKLSDLATQKCTGGLLTVEFTEVAPNENTGMYGSGVCLINPPYEVDQELNKVLRILKQKLCADRNRLSAIKWHVKAV